MKRMIAFLTCLACCNATAMIVVSGTVADEASKARLLARVRSLYGQDRVLDQMAVGTVATPANWDTHVHKLIGSHLKLLTKGQLTVDGNAVSIRGNVASETQRQELSGQIAASLNPTYSVNADLQVAASEQGLLDAALANRIIEFESGKAALTVAGIAILDQMSVALMKVKGKKVSVIGHTDNVGARSANLALSLARATAVKAYVIGKGIDPASISVSGAGPDRPVASNLSAAGRTRNRRIEFRIDP